MQPPSTACYSEDMVEDERLGWGGRACFSENSSDRRHWSPRIGLPLYKRGALSYRYLTPKLQTLTERTLIRGLHDPNERPAIRDWQIALAEAYDDMILCRNPACHQTVLSSRWVRPAATRACPFCGERIKPPFPSVLALMQERAKGVFTEVRPAVLYHGLPLFADLIEPGRLPPFSRQNTPIVGRTVWDPKEGVHRLINEGGSPWTAIGIGAVGRGASVPLRPGLLIGFGDGKLRAKVLE